MAINLLTLGMFVFGMDTIAFNEIQRRLASRHADSDRFGARAASQYLGPGPETLSITGVLIPELAGKFSHMARLEEMQASGENWPLIDGVGRIWGNYRIDNNDQRMSEFIAGGLTRKVEFTIELTRVS